MSISEAKRKLPEHFIERLQKQFSVHTADLILRGMCVERLTTLRVNSLKYDIQSLMNDFKKLNIKFERVSWYPDALVIKNKTERELEKTNHYQEGKIYLQSLSSMIPPLALDPKPEEKILDIAAAPGSKTTQMVSMMKNQGLISAHDINPLRIEKLKFNLDKQGADIVEVIQDKYERNKDLPPLFYDRVLLDVPCSGEGLFQAGSAGTYRWWSVKEVNKLASLQKKLFQLAVEALKEGGILVYSTCTLNEEENEEVVKWALENLSVEILENPLKIKNFEEPCRFDVGNKELEKKILRIIPDEKMEGFFVAKFRKK
ncbi:MAG: hypothetical protein A2Y41_01245 [Spirochaetes bacterium GWB1_36_13]|nr:MAG: hypothetical protein A2Y41_01245 [Spirochaetes bacterium GWB1_36_13]